jgi:hypothetical protein
MFVDCSDMTHCYFGVCVRVCVRVGVRVGVRVRVRVRVCVWVWGGVFHTT